MAENTVDVDEQAIAAELRELGGGSPANENLQPANADLHPGAADPAPVAPPPSPIDWTIASVGIVNLFAGVAENWELTDEEKRSLVDPLNQVFTAFFPDVHLSPKWQATGVLAMALGAIAYARMEDGKLRPLRKPKPSRDPNVEDAVELERRTHGARATA